MNSLSPNPSPTVFIIAGEESGDLLGANLMRALNDRFAGRVRFLGVGGARMAQLGLASMFPMEEIVRHGISDVLLHLPLLVRRIRQTVAAIVAARPDVLVLVDCPGFNLRVGRQVGARAPSIPIVDYVSPTVWAYFPGRARKMARYVDQLLALLPFEPAVHRKLGGPPTTYVGHPLVERMSSLAPLPGERAPLGHGRRPVLLVLPGSRRSEIRRLMDSFGETVARVVAETGPVELILPAVPQLSAEIRERAEKWKVRPAIVEGEVATYAAFRRAHAALAASGTVTLELGLSGVPMVVAYRVDPILRPFTGWLQSPSFVLTNLILGSNVIPEYLDGAADPDTLAAALTPLLSDSPQRRAQVSAFARLERIMAVDRGTPSSRAADIVVKAMETRPARAGASAA